MQSTSRGYDLGVIPLSGDRKPVAFLGGPFNEVQARLSPDGQWLAYASDESGRFEVFVRSFPTPGRQLPISGGGGMQPEWRRDGKELFYISAEGKVMVVDVNTEAKRHSPPVCRARCSTLKPPSPRRRIQAITL